jgi:hypothetical protein
VFGNLRQGTLRRGSARRRPLTLEPLERRELLASAWQNALLPDDVNADQAVTPYDALMVISELNLRGARVLPAPSDASGPPPYLDPTGDGTVQPLDALYVINAVNRSLPVAPPPTTYGAYFDFGTATSPVAAGYLAVNPATTYTPTLGYGWQSGTILGVNRSSGGDLDRDLNSTTNGTFAVDVPNGTYRVELILGDRERYAHDQMGVAVEGSWLGVVSTAAAQLRSAAYEVTVSDGQLTLHLQDFGGADGSVCIQALRIIPQEAPLSRTTDPWWPVYAEVPGAVFSAPVRDANGFEVYSVESEYQRSTTKIRVLVPSNYDPSGGPSYRTVYVLPVESADGARYGNGLVTVRDLNLHNEHPAIYVAPTFSDTPWYCDHSSDPLIRQESYFRDVVVPFIELRYPAMATRDARLLLGFSKSGWGAFTMLLRDPDFFGRAVAWDSPMGMQNASDIGGNGFSSVLGSTANFQNYSVRNLVLTRGPLLQGQPARLAMFGYYFDFTAQGMADLHNLMQSRGVPHRYLPGVQRAHRWDSGWVPQALDLLFV